LWEASQKYDGFYWTDNVYKYFHYHGKMREKQQLGCCAGGIGLAPAPPSLYRAGGLAGQSRAGGRQASPARGAGTPGPGGGLARLPRAGGAGTPGPRGGLARLARGGGWHAWPAPGAGTPARAGGWHAWPARGACTPGPRGGLARLASAGGWHAWPARGAGTPASAGDAWPGAGAHPCCPRPFPRGGWQECRPSSPLRPQAWSSWRHY